MTLRVAEPAAAPLASVSLAVRELVALQSQAYLFRRGPFDYSTHSYQSWPRTWSMQVDDLTIDRGTHRAALSFEMTAKIAPSSGPEAADIDDGAMDEMRQHALNVVRALSSRKWPGTGDDLVLGVFTPFRVVEFYDSAVGVQGVVFTFDVGF